MCVCVRICVCAFHTYEKQLYLAVLVRNVSMGLKWNLLRLPSLTQRTSTLPLDLL